MIIAKRKKKTKAKKEQIEDDPIDLQSLISSLKEDPNTDEDGTEEDPEATFEIVEEVKDEKEDAADSEEIKRLKAELEDVRAQLEQERADFEEQKKSTEAELRTIGGDILSKKEQITKFDEQLRKKENEQREKERNIKKATDLLISQRNALGEKEKKLETLKEDLQTKAQELKEKEEHLALYKDKTAELDAREIRIRELEDMIKEKELHIKKIEDELLDCPRCSSRDRFLSIERMIEELKTFGIHDEESENDLREMRRLIDAGDTERAIEMGDHVITRLKTTKEEVLVKGIKYLLIGAEKAIRHAKEIGGHGESIEDAERWLEEARSMIEKEEFKTAEYYIKEADFMVQSLTRGVTPSTEEAVPKEGFAKSYNCPSCYTTFTVDTSERPVRITCPGCQIELLIKEDVTFA